MANCFDESNERQRQRIKVLGVGPEGFLVKHGLNYNLKTGVRFKRQTVSVFVSVRLNRAVIVGIYHVSTKSTAPERLRVVLRDHVADGQTSEHMP